MATKASADVDDDVIEADPVEKDDAADDADAEPSEQEDPDADQPAEDAADALTDQADAADEIVVTIGEAAGDDDDVPPEDLAPSAKDAWARLRIAKTQAKKEARELRARLDAMQRQTPADTAADDPGPVPKIADFNYDDEKHGIAVAAWATKKAEASAKKAARDAEQSKQQQQWQGRIDAVQKAAATLKVRDYEEAAEEFTQHFSLVQQGIVMGGPDDAKASALLRYALGKNPRKAKELAAINDPVKFAFAVAKLETQLKVTPKKSAPPPESVVRSTVAGAAVVDNQLARLQAEADKTGDRSKVAAFMRQRALQKKA